MTFYQSWKDVPKEGWRWKNFSPRELACKGSGSLIVDEVALDRLQALRDALGVPLILVSAYRSPEHNRAVGGAKKSLHMKGIAFDVSMANHDPYVFEMAAKEAGFRGVGTYPRSDGPGFMHVDLGAERSWGKPFRRGATRLPPEPEKREKLVESTTVQASAVQVATGAGAAVSAVSGLDGTAQIVALVCAGVVVLAALWIMRERIKKWAEGAR
jgi:zinc D-Ala-D-Ala carboxypeptidase